MVGAGMRHGHGDVTGGAYVVELDCVDASMASVVGGKGANLGELQRVDAVRVPRGFCVTTTAFRAVLAAAAVLPQLDQLPATATEDTARTAELSGAIRTAIEGAEVPDDVTHAIVT